MTIPEMTFPAAMEKRRALRKELDAFPDCDVSGGGVKYQQRFVAVRFDETYVEAPDQVVDSAKNSSRLESVGLSPR